MLNAALQSEIYNNAMTMIGAALNRPMAAASSPILYGPNNKPLRPSAAPQYQIQRSAAKRAGSMKNWIPQRLLSQQQEQLEREAISIRATDLVNSDPHAAGVSETFATTVIGPGLIPIFTLDAELLGLEKEAARLLQKQMRANMTEWWSWADAGRRLSFGAIQNLLIRNSMQHGEYLVLLPMLDDPLRPFRLACQVIHPLRLKTPSDLLNNANIRDGVELGEYGEAVAYWIKKTSATGFTLSDNSANFERIEAKIGHRWRVLHGFLAKDAEQVRGISEFAPAMKLFRDLGDFLDAELVSNIVTAAFALFIEVGGGDPLVQAQRLAGFTETANSITGNEQTTRYQEFSPGLIMYGNSGEKPHPIAAARPGATFDPFVRVIKKAISASVNISYPVLFNDVDGVSFAGFRSAMLEAWRVFSARRIWLGEGFCQPVNTMLQEEAFLTGRLAIPDFYANMHRITAARWQGPPKGDIEPYKAVQADLLAIEGNLKTYEDAHADRGTESQSVFDQLEHEKALIREKHLSEPKSPPSTQSMQSTENAIARMEERLENAIDLLMEIHG